MKQVLSLKLWRCRIKECLLSEEHSSSAGVLGCMLPAQEEPFKSSFFFFSSELSGYSVDRLLYLMIKHKGCAMCYSQEASELKQCARKLWVLLAGQALIPCLQKLYSPQLRPNGGRAS